MQKSDQPDPMYPLNPVSAGLNENWHEYYHKQLSKSCRIEGAPDLKPKNRLRKSRLKVPSVHNCRTPPGLPKHLPNEECFAPWNENENKGIRARRQALKFAPARTPGHFLTRLRSRAAIFTEKLEFSNFEFRKEFSNGIINPKPKCITTRNQMIENDL